MEHSAGPLSSLVSWHELEEWRKDNHFIHTGYVRTSNSFKKVVHSLFYVHNETVNIYTHLLPAVLLALAILFVYDKYLPVYPQTTPTDHAAFLIFGASCITCLGLSATFHTFKSHSSRIMILGNKLDYLGICILIAGSMFAILQFCLDDHPKIKVFYMLLTAAFGTTCAVLSVKSKFRTPAWRPFRASMFVGYGLTGVLPIVTGWFLFGREETWARAGLGYMLGEAFFYIFGAFLYGILFPEKWAPGKFDNWGHSHQIFHVMVVIAAWCHFQALLQAYSYSVGRR